MNISQAIVISTGQPTATRVIACSHQIDSKMATEICRWCPGRSDLGFDAAQAISYFQLCENKLAFTRSIVGNGLHGAERERQVLTKVVVVESGQLKGYSDNIALLGHVLCSQGSMAFQSLEPNNEIDELVIPDSAMNLSRPLPNGCKSKKITQAIEIHHQVALLGVGNPLRFMIDFLDTIPKTERSKMSFGWGLKISKNRPFAIHLYREMNTNVAELNSQQIRTITVSSESSIAIA